MSGKGAEQQPGADPDDENPLDHLKKAATRVVNKGIDAVEDALTPPDKEVNRRKSDPEPPED